MLSRYYRELSKAKKATSHEFHHNMGASKVITSAFLSNILDVFELLTGMEATLNDFESISFPSARRLQDYGRGTNNN
jgi:hypothetical protein